MLIVLITIALLIVGFICFKLADNWIPVALETLFNVIAAVCLTVGCISAILSTSLLIGVHIAAPVAKINNQKTYEYIVYQIDNKYYVNDNEVGKFNFIQEIADYNIDREQNILLHNSPWVNWFNPDVYADLPEIPIPEYLTK